MRTMARAYAEGRIGKLRYIYASDKGYYGGYGLMNIGVHLLNYIIKFAGHCRSLTATALTDGHLITPEDVIPSANGMGTIAGENITATLQHDDNVTTNLLLHRFPVVDSTASGIQLFGTEGRMMWRSPWIWWLPTPHFLPDEEHGNWQALEEEAPDHYDPNGPANLDDYWFAEEWVRALDEGRDHEASGIEGRHVMEIMMGVFESAAYGHWLAHPPRPQTQRDHPARPLAARARPRRPRPHAAPLLRLARRRRPPPRRRHNKATGTAVTRCSISRYRAARPATTVPPNALPSVLSAAGNAEGCLREPGQTRPPFPPCSTHALRQ